MSWILLLIAGLLEVAWASLLPETHGLSRLWPTLGFVVFLVGSMVLLSIATREIPLGTAYAVWVGIGAVGAAVVGIIWHGEPATAARIGFLSLLVLSVIGLKLTSAH